MAKPTKPPTPAVMGSGSTGVAAERLGMNFIGIEADAGYMTIAQARMVK
jgi:DNA modification methylase